MPANTHHPEYDANVSTWKKCRDCVAGQGAVHAAGEVYLPKLSGQEAEEYKKYKARALFFNATGRTLDAMTGMLFRKAPVSVIPAGLNDIVADVTMGGTPLQTFAEEFAEELVEVGRIGILIDYPPANTEQTLTVSQTQALGLRPYAAIYKAESIINWETARVGNRMMLTRVVLEEQYTVDGKDEFEKKSAPQWRVLDLFEGSYRVRLFRKEKDKEDPVQVGGDFFPLMKNQRMSEIPFIFCAPNGLVADVAKPPLDDLADVNLSHYRLTADYEHGLHFTGLPTPVVTGFTGNQLGPNGEVSAVSLAIGSGTAWVLPEPAAKAFYLEFQGAGLGQVRDALTDKKDMMAALGARLLASEKKAVESAEAASIHRAGENSVLTSISNSASAALTKMLQWLAKWSGVDGEVSITLNSDFLPMGMDPQMLAELTKALQGGLISFDTYFWNLQQGEIIQAERTLEEEDDARASEVTVNGLTQ